MFVKSRRYLDGKIKILHARGSLPQISFVPFNVTLVFKVSPNPDLDHNGLSAVQLNLEKQSLECVL